MIINKNVYCAVLALLFFFFCLYAKEKKPLKILFVVGSFPSNTQTFILNQMTGLIDLGHEITIFARNHRYDIKNSLVDKYELRSKVYVDQLPDEKREYDIILCQFGTLGKNFFKEGHNYDIKGKVVTFFRGHDARPKHFVSEGPYKTLFEKGDCFLPVCNFFKNEMIKAGCDSNKIFVVHSAIDLDKFEFKPRKLSENRPIKIIMVGRLVEKKGTFYAIEAVSELINKGLNVEFNIIGGGPLESELINLINILGHSDKIHLLGTCSHAEVVNHLQKSHIFILPSIVTNKGDREGIPNALKEAMAVGLPVISTDHSGVLELVTDEESGYLVPERNSKKLAKKLSYLIKHPELWKKFGRNGRRSIKKFFNIKKENLKLEKICYLLLDEKG